MSLLVSITFSEETNRQIIRIINKLRRSSRKGWFNKIDNLRLNLLTIYDADDLRIIESAINKIQAEPFDITFHSIDRSRRDGGDIYWLYAKPHPSLQGLYDNIQALADEYEYDYDKTEFKSRLQLGEMIIARPKFTVEEFSAHVDNITLFEHTKRGIKSFYKEIYSRKL